MDLQDKLKYYQERSVKGTGAEPLRSQVSDLCRELDAVLVDPEAPPVLRITRLHPYAHFIPEREVSSRREIRIPLLAKTRDAEPIRPDDVLLFDLETTGLAGGAGTFPFLLGFAEYREDGLQTVQYFLPDYGREDIAFSALRGDLKDKNILLSFNGKSYDYPLLRNRFILNRMENPFKDFAHLDLLHLARRIWKGMLPNCSLQSIEREVFFFNRIGDLDGWLIPQAYFDFVRTGQLSDIVRIINHNMLDLMSMARLFLHLDQIENSSASDAEIIRLMHLAIKRNEPGRVDRFLSDLKTRGVRIPEQVTVDFSLYLKRKQDWEQAVALWSRLSAAGEHVLFAHLELAKYYEHQVRDLFLAEKHAERALDFLKTLSEFKDITALTDSIRLVKYRLDRIRRKTQRTEGE